LERRPEGASAHLPGRLCNVSFHYTGLAIKDRHYISMVPKMLLMFQYYQTEPRIKGPMAWNDGVGRGPSRAGGMLDNLKYAATLVESTFGPDPIGSQKVPP
jgi:hypothetical protein